ncbi:ribonuclease H-like domain-containing protein [Tanacetum coccineum]
MRPELITTRMTLELANQSIAYPAGIADDVCVQVGKFTFPTDFVVVDYDFDSRVPLILGRPFLRTTRALVDVYGEELILRDGDEKLIFHADSTSKHPHHKIHRVFLNNIFVVKTVGVLMKESTIPLNEIDSQIPSSIAITPVLSTLEPEDYLIMGDEELSIIPEKESDEFIKSSVEDLVPIPSESEDTSESDSDCDLSSYDDFSPINVYEENFVTFSNPLFDSNDDFTSSDDESLSDEDVPEELSKIYLSIAFQFSRGFTDEPPLEENDDLFDLESKENEWKKILYDASIDDLMTEDKVFDPDIHEKNFSPTYVKLPYEDRHYLSFTYVIRIFLSYFTYLVDSSLPLSSGSEDIIFDPGISAYHFSSLDPVVSHQSETFMCFNVYLNILNESPMEIYSSTSFVPNITMI